MVGPWPLAPHHDHLQYIHHIHLNATGSKPGCYIMLNSCHREMHPFLPIFLVAHTYPATPTLPKTPSYSTYPPQIPQPQISKSMQLEFLSTPNPPRPTKFPNQPISNPNNDKTIQPTYNNEIQTFPTYTINSLSLKYIHLISRTLLTRIL